MRNPVTFRELTQLAGIILIMGVGFYLLLQIPFVYSFFVKIGNVVEALNRNTY